MYLSLDSSDAAGTFMPWPWLALAVVDMLVQSRSVKTVLCACYRDLISRSLLVQNWINYPKLYSGEGGTASL